MKTVLFILLMLAVCFCAFWLRTFPFREKKTNEPERTAPAEVISRRVQSGANRTGRSSGMGYSYLVTFRLGDGTEKAIYAHDEEYGALREGMKGTLTWKGRYFVSFDTED